MDNGYHDKRQSRRRKEDNQTDFLKTIIKLAIRLKEIEAIKDVLSQGLDTIEKG